MFMQKALKNNERLLEQAIHRAERNIIVKERREIKLSVTADIYDKYSGLSDKFINKDIISYLEDRAKYVPAFEKLTILVESPYVSIMDELHSGINAELKKRLSDIEYELRKDLGESALLFLAGAISFIFETFFAIGFQSKVLDNLMVIVCWVFIWRAVEVFFLERRDLRKQKRKLLQLYLADYEYSGTNQ